MAKRNYEKTIFLNFLTEAQIREAQEVAAAEKQSVTDVLGRMVTNAIEDNPEDTAALEAARTRALDNFVYLVSAPLAELSEADELDAIDYAA